MSDDTLRCQRCGGNILDPDHDANCGRYAQPEGTTDEAFDRLEQTRKELIERGRVNARALFAAKGWVTTEDVRLAMIAEGTYRSDIPGHWLPAVFRAREWEPFGWHLPEQQLGAAHAWRPIKKWRQRVAA